MKITVLKSSNGGVAFYRSIQPYNYLKKYFDIFIFDSEMYHPYMLYEYMQASDILVYQMPWGKSIADAIEKNKKEKHPKKIVVEFDDNIFHVNPYNNAYAKFGTEEIQNCFLDKPTIDYMKSTGWKPTEHVGENTLHQLKLLGVNPKDAFIIDLWKDGEREFDVKRNILDARYTQYTVANADVVTCTTVELGKQLRKYRPKGEIAVMPNLVDTSRFLPMKPNDTDEIRIGWQGGDAHFLDLLQIMPAIDKVFEKHKNAKFVTMGGYFPSLFSGELYKGRYEHIDWHSDINTYPLRVRDMKCDIMIAPLIKDRFNDCKSELKWLEYSALKVPGVYSKTVYGNEVKHGKTGLIADSVGEWEKYLNELIENKDLRKEIADKAYTRVSTYHNLNAADCYKEMLLRLYMSDKLKIA